MSRVFVNEIFWSLQGEGLFTGVPAIFLRLQGCHISCPFCDTRYAQDLLPSNRLKDNSALILEKKTSTPAYAAADVAWILDTLEKKQSSYKACVVLTGGEPFEQDITALVQSLRCAHYPVHIETSGHLPIPCAEDAWITLSPKAAGVLEENWEKADEIKLPVKEERDITRYEAKLAHIAKERVLLQPIDCSSEATALCIDYCMRYNWRLSLQTHKYIGLR